MKIICIADFSGETSLLGAILERCMNEDPDCIVFCGNVVEGKARREELLAAKKEGREPVKTKEIEKEIAKDEKDLREFYLTLMKPGISLLAIPGNMDAPEGAYLKVMEEVSAEGNLRMMHRKSDTIGGYSFAGFGGEIGKESEHFFMLSYPEEAFAREMGELKADVLLFYSPPKDMKVDASDDKYVGSTAVREAIEKIKPILVFCGGAQKKGAVDHIGRTTVVSPGALKYGNMAIVKLDGEDVKVELATLKQ